MWKKKKKTEKSEGKEGSEGGRVEGGRAACANRVGGTKRVSTWAGVIDSENHEKVALIL